jgi:hypothetical protein
MDQNDTLPGTEDNVQEQLEGQDATSADTLFGKVRTYPPEEGDMSGAYPGSTFSHQGTDYRYAFFGKRNSWGPRNWEDMEPFPPVPGLTRRMFRVYCRRDTCVVNNGVLALRSPQNKTLVEWMSLRVKDFIEKSLVNVVHDDQPAITILACPHPQTAGGICSFFSVMLKVRLGFLPSYKLEMVVKEGRSVEQEGLLLFDCWQAGDLYTFYEATWYDWMSLGDTTRESYRTIDARTGKELSLEDFVDEKDYLSFARILMKRLTVAAGSRAAALADYAPDGSDVLPLLDGCGLVKEGLVVYFYPYTLSAGFYGQFNAVIPYQELGSILKVRWK